MLKSVFRPDGRCNKDGIALVRQATASLQPLIEEWLECGYGVREIAHVVHLSLTDLETKTILSGEAQGDGNGT